jgi:hypothetical protein
MSSKFLERPGEDKCRLQPGAGLYFFNRLCHSHLSFVLLRVLRGIYKHKILANPKLSFYHEVHEEKEVCFFSSTL